MLLRRYKALAIIALLSIGVSNGFHVAALQGFAWVRMYAAYSEVLPASEALELTFSGKEICGICVAADEIQADMEDAWTDFASNAAAPLLILPRAVSTSIRTEAWEIDRLVDGGRRLVAYCSSLDSPPPRSLVS